MGSLWHNHGTIIIKVTPYSKGRGRGGWEEGVGREGSEGGVWREG